jgi:CubicO group peptidase (beta-lactamase class C family)
MTRFFVALAILKLQDEGKLSVNDRICRYVSGCPTAWRPITIVELLTGTSGIDSYDPFAPGATLDQVMPACKSHPLLFKPGSYSPPVSSPWSDCNTLLMDIAIQKLTGKPWESAMQELVYGPAHMTNTGRMTNTLKPPRRGRLYRGGVPTPELNYDGFYLAYTTLEDVVRLNHALLAGTVISPNSLDALFNAGLPVDPYRGYEVLINWVQTPTSPNAVPYYPMICEACVNGGGEDDWGNQAGFFMTVSMSRGGDSIQIELNNDSALYNPGDNENAFAAFIGKELYGR